MPDQTVTFPDQNVIEAGDHILALLTETEMPMSDILADLCSHTAEGNGIPTGIAIMAIGQLLADGKIHEASKYRAGRLISVGFQLPEQPTP